MITINATAITNITSRKCFLCRNRLLNSKDNEWLQAFWAFKRQVMLVKIPKELTPDLSEKEHLQNWQQMLEADSHLQ